MRTPNSAGSSYFLLAALVFVAPSLTLAAPQDQSELREQLKSAVESDVPLDLDTVQKLQQLLAAEERRLQRKSVAPWIKELQAAEFSEREDAEKNLIDAGAISISSVLSAAKKGDREVSERCITILARIAKSKNKEAVIKSQEALTELANDESAIGRRAAQVLTELNKTDKDRALAALKAVGARVHQGADGEVSSVSAFRGLSDREMKHLAAFPRLRMLTASGAGITDAGLSHLSNLNHLRHLSLFRTAITDAGIATIAALPNLEMLSINCSNVTSAGLQKLSDTKGLRTLSLQEFKPDLASVEIIKGMKVQHLVLSLKHASDEDLAIVRQISKLSNLMLTDSDAVTDNGIAALAELPLRTLHVDSSSITDAGLQQIGKIASLDSLQLSSGKITDAGLKQLFDLKGLESIMLRGTDVTDDGVKQLQAAIPGLTRVYR